MVLWLDHSEDSKNTARTGRHPVRVFKWEKGWVAS